MAIDRNSTRPLTGIRVLDLSRVVSGPLCGRILADMGAEVIKVEPPEGDVLRDLLPATNGLSHIYAHFNAGKRQICVDLKQDEGRALVADLVEQSDILLENFRPGVTDRLGIGAPAMLARNPRLIYCSISGWGQHGPDSQKPAYAPMIHAEMGTLALAAEKHASPIRQEVHHHADLYAGVMASSAILAAFAQRVRTGKGQQLDVSMAEVMLYVNEYSSIGGYSGGQTLDSHQFEVFTIRDGTIVNLIGNPRHLFLRWTAALDAPELAADPRFETPDSLDANRDAARAAMSELMQSVPDVASLEHAFSDHGLLFAVVRSPGAALESEWAHERHVMQEVLPGLRIPRSPWRGTDQTTASPSPPGQLGEDNTDVLHEVLSLENSEIESLCDRGVLCSRRTPGLAPA